MTCRQNDAAWHCRSAAGGAELTNLSAGQDGQTWRIEKSAVATERKIRWTGWKKLTRDESPFDRGRLSPGKHPCCLIVPPGTSPPCRRGTLLTSSDELSIRAIFFGANVTIAFPRLRIHEEKLSLPRRRQSTRATENGDTKC